MVPQNVKLVSGTRKALHYKTYICSQPLDVTASFAYDSSSVLQEKEAEAIYQSNSAHKTQFLPIINSYFQEIFQM